jgi:hypothetical protein
MLFWYIVDNQLKLMYLVTWVKEARVRYHGFSKDEDEWINVKDGVRQRSIPLEASECHKVKEGHLVLCFLVMDSSLFYCTYINIVSGVHVIDAVLCTRQILFAHTTRHEQWERNFLCWFNTRLRGFQRKISCKIMWLVSNISNSNGILFFFSF